MNEAGLKHDTDPPVYNPEVQQTGKSKRLTGGTKVDIMENIYLRSKNCSAQSLNMLQNRDNKSDIYTSKSYDQFNKEAIDTAKSSEKIFNIFLKEKMHRSERIRTQEGIVDNDKRNSIGQNTAGFTYGTHPVKASGIGSIGKLFAQNKKQKLISEKEMEEIQKKFMTDVGSDKSIKLQSDDVYSRKRGNKLTSFSYRASFDSLQRLKGRNDSNSFFLRVFNKKRDIRHIEELESDDLNLSNFSNFNKNEHHSSDDGYDEKAAKSRFRVSRKVIVWVVFVLVVMVVVAGYILWPRNPLILLQGLETTDIPNILFDYENSNYAVSVSVMFSVIGVSYNFYPQTLKKITTNISLQSTGTALGTHTENNVVLNGQESSTVKINTWLSYKTSDIADSTIVEMFNKCGYVNPLVYRNNSSEQGYLDLAVQTDVQAKSLIFTTHQKVVGQFKVQCHS